MQGAGGVMGQMNEEIKSGSPRNIVKNLYFLMTCVATFTCIIRSDFNFAFGLLGYYMIKTANEKKLQRTANTVSIKFSKNNMNFDYSCYLSQLC